MIRRLRMACVGLGIFMLPACASNKQLSDPYYSGDGPGYELMNRPDAPPYRQAPDKAAGKPQVEASTRQVGPYNRQAMDKSADKIQVEAGTRQAGPYNRQAPGNSSPYGQLAGQKSGPALQPDKLPANVRQPESDLVEQPTKAAARPIEKAGQFEQPVAVSSPLTDRSLWPKIAVDTVEEPKDRAEPKEVSAPKWPQLGPQTADDKSPVQAPNLLPALDLPPPPEAHPTPVAAPPLAPVQPMSMGTSMKVADPVRPVVGTAAGPLAADETLLVGAIKAFQSNRPDEAVDLLKRLDPLNQEVLLYLMPLLVRLGEGNLQAMPPDELAMQIDRLQAATGMLKSKASLRIDRAIFCRGVRKFADIDPYDPRHEFRPGDMVFLYAELKNFTCETREKLAGVNGDSRPAPGVSIRLGASLELRDARNGLVWRTDLSKNDVAQTPPQDYYHTYRFCVPEKLPPGTYTLWLTVIDKPTNRAIRKPIEMRVGQG